MPFAPFIILNLHTRTIYLSLRKDFTMPPYSICEVHSIHMLVADIVSAVSVSNVLITSYLFDHHRQVTCLLVE